MFHCSFLTHYLDPFTSKHLAGDHSGDSQNCRIMEPLKVDWNQELRKSVLKGKLEEMDIAIAYGANINHIYKGGWTLPHFCARNNQLEALKQIVLRGGKLGAQKLDGSTALHIASSNGFIDIVKTLVFHGANILSKNFEGNTALHISCHKGWEKVTEFLVLEGGANAAEVNSRGETALHLASANGHVGSMKTLFEHYHPQNQDNKLDLNAKTLKGNTPLHFAIFFQKKKAEEFLLRKGADVSIKNRKGVVAVENSRCSKKRDNVKVYKSRKRPHRTLLPQIFPPKGSISQTQNGRQRVDPKAPSPADQYDWERYAKRLKAILDKNQISSPSVSCFKNTDKVVNSISVDVAGPESEFAKDPFDSTINFKIGSAQKQNHIRKLFSSPVGVRKKIPFSIERKSITEDRENMPGRPNIVRKRCPVPSDCVSLK